MLLRLKFYEIEEGNDYYLSTKKEFYNYDDKISIYYYEKSYLQFI